MGAAVKMSRVARETSTDDQCMMLTMLLLLEPLFSTSRSSSCQCVERCCKVKIVDPKLTIARFVGTSRLIDAKQISYWKTRVAAAAAAASVR